MLPHNFPPDVTNPSSSNTTLAPTKQHLTLLKEMLLTTFDDLKYLPNFALYSKLEERSLFLQRQIQFKLSIWLGSRLFDSSHGCLHMVISILESIIFIPQKSEPVVLAFEAFVVFIFWIGRGNYGVTCFPSQKVWFFSKFTDRVKGNTCQFSSTFGEWLDSIRIFAQHIPMQWITLVGNKMQFALLCEIFKFLHFVDIALPYLLLYTGLTGTKLLASSA